MKKEFFIGPYDKTKIETETDSILEDTVLKIEDDASEGMKIFTFEFKKSIPFIRRMVSIKMKRRRAP